MEQGPRWVRIRRVTTASGSGSLSLGSVRVSLDLWALWADIAFEHEESARRERRRLLTRFRDEPGYGYQPETTNELEASIICVAAVGHSLDALYGQVSQELPRPSANVAPTPCSTSRRPKRASHIREALKLRFATGRVDQQRWVTEFEWLFSLRDAAVHPRWAIHHPVLHPSLIGFHVSPQVVDYSAESAVRANELLLDVLQTCTTAFKPQPAHEDARQWGQARHAGIAERIARTEASRDQMPLAMQPG